MTAVSSFLSAFIMKELWTEYTRYLELFCIVQEFSDLSYITVAGQSLSIWSTVWRVIFFIHGFFFSSLQDQLMYEKLKESLTRWTTFGYHFVLKIKFKRRNWLCFLLIIVLCIYPAVRLKLMEQHYFTWSKISSNYVCNKVNVIKCFTAF